MNKETLDLVKKYVTSTLSELGGINEEAYNALMSLMQANRDFAQEMHEEVSCISHRDGRYVIETLNSDIEYDQEL